MEPRCDYCFQAAKKVTVVVLYDRCSGPPFIKVACDGCMRARKLSPAT